MRKSFGIVGLFLACSAFSFWLTIPRSTNAAVFTVAGDGCWSTPNVGTVCSLPQGTTVPIASLIGVYFDWLAPSGNPVELVIYKNSYSGSSYVDYAVVKGTGASRDDYVSANNVRTNASQWDYLSAQLNYASGDGAINVWGVTMTNGQ